MPIPFKFLGFTHDGKLIPRYEFHFLADAIGYPTHIKKSVIDNSGSLILFTLAPMSFWRAVFPNKKDGIDWKRANNWVAHKSFAAGYYAPKSDEPIVHKDLKGRAGY